MADSLRSKIASLMRSPELRGVATLGAGTAVSQLLPVVMSFILSRLYTPEAFGDYGVFINYASVIAIVICARYEYAIMRPRREVDALNLVALCLLLACGVTVLLYALLGAADIAGADVGGAVPLRYLLPVYALAVAVMQIFSNYANRRAAYGVTASASVVRSVTQAVSRLVMGLAKVPGGLVLGCLLGAAAGCAASARGTGVVRSVGRSLSVAGLRRVAAAYAAFPRYQLAGSLLNALSTAMPVILIDYFYGSRTTGFFTMAVSLLYLPSTMVGNAMGQVFYRRAVTDTVAGASRLALRFFAFNFVVALVMFVVLWLGGAPMFRLLLGGEWGMIGDYAFYLSPWLMAALCFTPLTWAFDAYDHLKAEMVLNVAMFVCRAGGVAVCGLAGAGADVTMAVCGLVGLLLYVTQGWCVSRYLEVRASVTCRVVVAVLALAVVGVWAARVAACLW